jgi:hypothetical protein
LLGLAGEGESGYLSGQLFFAPGTLGYFCCIHRAGKKIENRVAVMAEKFIYRHVTLRP